ncbi:hypothetical protein AGABI2DRAFT_122886 [Agaricus bisporus var. bisporus H97]|uniref:hypothetical protein n=1 Tax=Agaricus bisporus var. bisporus (strain H97 / ATCC MYA-4626 / FGSC 10389) TaxID=936046 RepID=UPI00029F52B5|nr:hypothetical protein AGABI2DRAFT_122886 [Agaricus bisporus var. bisporus H97]EKV42156.1 hypothetical protein AGABI2DRAFT_122886 [Agaricus bisporus var. bisporus H97]
MTTTRKWIRFKASLRDFFFSEDEDGIQNGPRRPAGPEGFFTNAQHSTLHNPTMTAVHGNQYNTFSSTEGDRNVVTQMMNLLSQNIIRGAAHDSSVRDPPPRCHPDTRVKLINRITAWFEGQASLELLLWITGPAGVGKSAVVQTFAEYLVKSHLLGASVFISRPNKRDNPHGVFITIAYQLATRIEAYRDYIVERLRLDPELLNGDRQAQFTTFIVEPFTVKKLGASGKRWGILLDGLDELRGTDAQCEIIQLISSFVHEHPNAPLVWIIASRPESRISHTFSDDEVQRSCWSEYIPIDSTEACEDVERFLRSSFKTTQKNFRHCVSSDWPSNADFLKLTAAASGLFIYAQVVMQFIGDSHHADPVARLEALISVIDRSNAFPTKDNPFVHLDALYHEILSSIPSRVWPTTKQLLGVAIYGGHIRLGRFGYNLRPNLLTLRGMSILFGITRNTVYASLDKARSTLKISDWKVAHKKPLTFLHASFADYLKESSRSGDFHVGSEEDVKKEVILKLLEIWNKCCGDDIATSSVEPAWQRYCSELTDKSSSRAIGNFHTNLLYDTIFNLTGAVYDISCNPMESPAYISLRNLHIRKLCYLLKAEHADHFVFSMMSISPEPRHIGFLREVRLEDLEFGHLDWKEMSPVYAHYGKKGLFHGETCLIHRPRSIAELKAFMSDLLSLQERSPELAVVILGGTPKERVAVFQSPLNKKPIYLADFIYYVIPYPE